MTVTVIVFFSYGNYCMKCNHIPPSREISTYNISQSNHPTINGRKNLKTALNRNRSYLPHHSPYTNGQRKRDRKAKERTKEK